jgi:hypothetical protein
MDIYGEVCSAPNLLLTPEAGVRAGMGALGVLKADPAGRGGASGAAIFLFQNKI